MNLLLLFACVGMITGAFILLRLSPMELTDAVFRRLTAKPRSIRDELGEYTGRKKKGFLRRELAETQAILKATGKSERFPMLCAVSLLCFTIGASIAIVMGNVFLVPVLAVGMMLLPFWWVKLTAHSYKKAVTAELETALSIITTAYLRTEDIQTAVEENLDYLRPPVRGVFSEFLFRVKRVDPDVDAAIRAMEPAIDNDVFREWCKAIGACQHDRGLKATLVPIIAKLSDMRIVNGELENLVFAPRKEFVSMVVLVAGNVPLMRLLNADWYHTLMHTVAGQIVLAICAAAVFLCSARVLKLTQPIEYRR